MLNQTFLKFSRQSIRHNSVGRQRGVVMLVALIVLVIMTLAGLGLMRSMDTTNLIAGNLAFKQAATQAGDQGIEAAISWLEANSGAGVLDADNANFGYKASAIMGAPLANLSNDFLSNSSPNLQSIDTFWAAMLKFSTPCFPPVGPLGCAGKGAVTNVNAAGNFYGFMIQRLCASPGDRSNPATGCAVLPSITTLSSGSNEGPGSGSGSGKKTLTAKALGAFYRITVQTTGPRNTVSYVQAIISM